MQWKDYIEAFLEGTICPIYNFLIFMQLDCPMSYQCWSKKFVPSPNLRFLINCWGRPNRSSWCLDHSCDLGHEYLSLRSLWLIENEMLTSYVSFVISGVLVQVVVTSFRSTCLLMIIFLKGWADLSLVKLTWWFFSLFFLKWLLNLLKLRGTS